MHVEQWLDQAGFSACILYITPGG